MGLRAYRAVRRRAHVHNVCFLLRSLRETAILRFRADLTGFPPMFGPSGLPYGSTVRSPTVRQLRHDLNILFSRAISRSCTGTALRTRCDVLNLAPALSPQHNTTHIGTQIQHTVTAQSQHSHSTVTTQHTLEHSQSQHSHSTVTAQSQHSTVTTHIGTLKCTVHLQTRVVSALVAQKNKNKKTPVVDHHACYSRSIGC